MKYEELSKLPKEDFQVPSEINLPKATIYKFAETISRKYRESIGETNKIDLFKFVESQKGDIHCVKLSDYLKSGSIYVHAPKNFDIVLPLFTSPIRDRFTIAHEMGHYFLHSFAGEKKILANRQRSNLVEWEANWFAASFLMPKYLIKSLNIDSPEKMAEMFGVSKEAAIYRYNNCEI